MRPRISGADSGFFCGRTMDIFEEAKKIVRANPQEFQPILDTITSRIMTGKNLLKPGEIQKAFLCLWPIAEAKEVILIGWLLWDTSIRGGFPEVNHTLAELLLDSFEGDESLNPASLQDWINGDIFHLEQSKKRLTDAINGYRPIPKPPLGKVATLLYEKLKSLPEHKAMNTPELSQWLADEHKHLMDDATLRNHLKQLEPYGIQNKTRIGYYIRQ